MKNFSNLFEDAEYNKHARQDYVYCIGDSLKGIFWEEKICCYGSWCIFVGTCIFLRKREDKYRTLTVFMEAFLCFYVDTITPVRRNHQSKPKIKKMLTIQELEINLLKKFNSQF